MQIPSEAWPWVHSGSAGAGVTVRAVAALECTVPALSEALVGLRRSSYTPPSTRAKRHGTAKAGGDGAVQGHGVQMAPAQLLRDNSSSANISGRTPFSAATKGARLARGAGLGMNRKGQSQSRLRESLVQVVSAGSPVGRSRTCRCSGPGPCGSQLALGVDSRHGLLPASRNPRPKKSRPPRGFRAAGR